MNDRIAPITPYEWFSKYLDNLQKIINECASITIDKTGENLKCIKDCIDILNAEYQNMTWNDVSTLENKIYPILKNVLSDYQDLTGLFNKIQQEIARKETIEKDHKINVIISERIQDYIDKNDKKIKAIFANPQIKISFANRYIKSIPDNDYYNKIAAYTKVIKLDPTNARAYLKRGKLHLQTMQYTKAIADCTDAKKISKLNSKRVKNPLVHKPLDRKSLVSCYETRAKAYYNINKFDKGIFDMFEAAKLDKSIDNNLTIDFQENGHMWAIKTAFNIDPDDKESNKCLEKVFKNNLFVSPDKLLADIKEIEDKPLQIKILKYALNKKSPLGKWLNDQVGFFGNYPSKIIKERIIMSCLNLIVI